MSEDYKYGLSKEEYDKAMADMHNAYKIRDENGKAIGCVQIIDDLRPPVTANPVAMYLRALFDMVQNGTIVLAPSSGDYRSSEHTGYVRDGCWWLRNRDIYPKVTQYWNRMGVMFPLKERNILRMMADNNIIEIDYEGAKKLYSWKSAVEGQPRMMVLNVANAQDFLRQELEEF